jgi:hypothetical protein
VITQQDVENYGPELVDFSRRAALEALGPEVRQLQQQNANLQAHLRQQTRHNLEQDLDRSVPGWRQTWADPQWRQWLDYSGRSRRELINHAAETGDAARVARFFQQPPASQGGRSYRARQPATGAKPIYSREDIRRLYEQRRHGAISDARWAQIETDIIAAGREGRVTSSFDKYGNEMRLQ